MDKSGSKASFDPAATFVRVVQVRDDGFVELEFGVGEPGLFVEMILPQAAFDDFCAANKATLLGPQAPEPAPRNDWEWRLRDAMQKRLGD
jgi:phenol hydroxylase P0 protein